MVPLLSHMMFCAMVVVVLMLVRQRGGQSRRYHVLILHGGIICWVVGNSLPLMHDNRPFFVIPDWMPVVVLVGAVMLGVSQLVFAAIFPSPNRKLILAACFLTLLGILCARGSIDPTAPGLHAPENILFPPSGTHPIWLWLALCMAILFFRLQQLTTTVHGHERLQLRYLLAGVVVLALGELLHFLSPKFDRFYSNYLYYTLACPLAMVLITYAITAFPLINGRVLLQPFLPLSFTTLTISFLFTYTLSSSIHPESLLVYSFIALSTLPIHRFYTFFIDRFLLKAPYDIRLVLDEISELLFSVREMRILEERISTVIQRTINPLFCACYLSMDTATPHIVEKTSIPDTLPPTLDHLPPLWNGLQQRRRLLFADDLLRSPIIQDAQLGLFLRAQQIAIAIPLFLEEQFHGCLLLGVKTSGEAYFRDDIRLLRILGQQVSLSLANIQHYDALQQLNQELEQRIDERTHELARLNTQLQEADQAKDRFLALVSHELLNPLTSVLLWTEIGSAATDNARRTQAFQHIHRDAMHVNRLVSDLLDISRIIHGKFVISCHPMDLWQVAQQALEAFTHEAPNKSIKLVVVPPMTALPVSGDTERLTQVICNIIGNAFKFTPPGGQITVHAERRDGCANITIRDTGKGIAPSELQTIFTLFHQQQGDQAAGGLGIGLSLVKGIIDLHGGRITAESPGQGLGSTFTIELPLLDSPADTGDSPHALNGELVHG